MAFKRSGVRSSLAPRDQEKKTVYAKVVFFANKPGERPDIACREGQEFDPP